MRIAFVDLLTWDYKVESAYQMPLGGSQSALCYLAEALAQQGHEVFLFNHTLRSGISCGVVCLHLSSMSPELTQSLDVLIIQNSPGHGVQIRSILGDQIPLILWTQHSYNQPATYPLQDPQERDIYDAIVLISDWQRDCFHQYLGINPSQTWVLRNAIGPAFANIFPADTSILAQKSQPPVLAYTSTPFRGLNILLDVFPRIRQAIPGTRLKVFSSMKVYQCAETEENSEYSALYRQCRDTEGVEYIGSIPQPDLARELKSVNVLAYPNSFAETSCIAVMEAMASGCRIVTSDLGALPETTAGFARLISMEPDWEIYKNHFVDEMIQILQEFTATDTTKLETLLRQQVDYVNSSYIWSVRAREWVEWLTDFCAKSRVTPSLSLLAPHPEPPADLGQQAYQCLIQNEYAEAVSWYEQAIAADSTVMSHYWHLGLGLLLQGQEAEAQSTWLLAMADGTEAEIELWTAELIQVLQTEAQRRENLAEDQIVWAIRQHIREIVPTDLNNLLALVLLAIKLEILTGEELGEAIALLKSVPKPEVNSHLLLQVLRQMLAYLPLHPSSLELAETCLPYVVEEPTSFLAIIFPAAIKIAYSSNVAGLAAMLMELCWQLTPGNPEVLYQLAAFYQDALDYTKGIDTAKSCYALSPALPARIYSNYLIMRGLMKAGGHWQEFDEIAQRQDLLCQELIAVEPLLDQTMSLRMFNSNYFLPYFRDDLKNHRQIQNQLARVGQSNLRLSNQVLTEKCRQRISSIPQINPGRPLKIGYLSHCLKRHSVGWLARWIFQHHDRDRFQIFAYLLNATQRDDLLQEWYIKQAFKAYKFGLELTEVVEQICEDEIDILVDLDSITLDITCGIMALKPAPIQVTWLGWDAAGIPAIDYFIADPYVLPDYAEDYYQEKIWRLPQTYIAVDGFELDVPSLRREQLNLPADAVIYFSAQRGFKQHPQAARLQIKILKNVPNSYFLIKCLADQESIKNLFFQIGEEEGVERDRLIFLPEIPLEEVHRANLGIADIVLDTYPYNGASTTLETLWMEIPLVTRVGEQFASRNSYTMMMNVGITEGIAWTDEEYVEWGVRLGKEPLLRQNISWRLRQAKQTSPLWNAQQFTREMEKAYQQMWENYLKNR